MRALAPRAQFGGWARAQIGGWALGADRRMSPGRSLTDEPWTQYEQETNYIRKDKLIYFRVNFMVEAKM